MFFSASATAARSDSSAASEALNNSACVTASRLGGELGAVEFFGEFQQRVVAAALNGVEDGAGALLDDRIKQAGRRGQLRGVFPENSRRCGG